MEEREFTVEPEDVGQRIDKFITLRLGEGYSRTLVKTLMDDGFVKVNDKEVKPNYSAREGDKVFMELPPPEASHLEPEDIPVDILFEDECLIVVNKSADMVVHPGAGNKQGTLAGALLHHCGTLPDSDDKVRPGIVHRLDKDTTGVIVVAKNDKAMRSLAKQFHDREVNKRYLAIVKGRVEMDNGVVEVPIARHSTDRRKMDVDHEKGRHAKTVYHVLERFEKFTLLALDLETGRTHQIRLHMLHLGHPVVGDMTYGGDRQMPRQALHAEKLSFRHPGTGKQMEFVAPMPEDMREFIKKLKTADSS
ncbi:MAG: RluA family pseudouridine synthase [Candidatus Tantalella remota]|nr:RluA family pseudouridine synthase [Candidatus Tantalella remota]